jgi:hypothetical protein
MKKEEGSKWLKKYKFVETAEDLQLKKHVRFANPQIYLRAGRVWS